MTIKYISYQLSIAGLILLTACGGGNQSGRPAPPPAAVSVHKVSLSDASYYEEYPGTVKALQEVELRPQVSGYITGIHFKEGDQVKKGEKLYSIDPQQTSASYNQALANVAVQEANLEKARKDLERYKKLSAEDAIARQQLDYAEAAYTSAQKQVEAAKAAVQNTQTSLRYSTIVAPFDGTIGISQVKLGAAVIPGQTLLNTISSNDPIGVDIAIDQSEIFMFSKFLANKENNTDSVFQLVFDGEAYPHFGSISFMDRAVDPMTGTIKVRVEFKNASSLLKPGMTGTLRVLSTKEKSILIPYKSITEQLGEFFVYTVQEENKVSQQKVKLGKQVGKNIIVENGLKTGETIVVEGVQKLREGATVSID